ncbi:hypothetical protein [Aminicella lysinilytica]|uniref:Uncharacterized protein n=1 Tax=Aminicella lysinilytica TaxID=433323 RepID=A0A4R6Q9T3_9FIRM|nr:hypothetical protein [Aminicella lysinilytica]TDP59071.1 hypothetical protein EV211_1041 [Aminicella lysinilytica]
MLKRSKMISSLLVVALAVMVCISMLGVYNISYGAGPGDEYSGKALTVNKIDLYGDTDNDVRNEGLAVSKLKRTISDLVIDKPGLAKVVTSAKDSDNRWLDVSIAVYKDKACTEKVEQVKVEEGYLDENTGSANYYFSEAGTYYLAYNNNYDNISGNASILIEFYKNISNFTYSGAGTYDENSQVAGTLNAVPTTMKFVPKVTGVYAFNGDYVKVLNSKKKVISNTKYGDMSSFGLKKNTTYYIYYPVISGASVESTYFGPGRVTGLSSSATSFSKARKLKSITLKGTGTEDEDYEGQYIKAGMYIGSKSSAWIKLKVTGKKSFAFATTGSFNGKYSAVMYSSGGKKLFTVTRKDTKRTLKKGTYYIKFSRSSSTYSGTAGIEAF